MKVISNNLHVQNSNIKENNPSEKKPLTSIKKLIDTNTTDFAGVSKLPLKMRCKKCTPFNLQVMNNVIDEIEKENVNKEINYNQFVKDLTDNL